MRRTSVWPLGGAQPVFVRWADATLTPLIVIHCHLAVCQRPRQRMKNEEKPASLGLADPEPPPSTQPGRRSPFTCLCICISRQNNTNRRRWCAHGERRWQRAVLARQDRLRTGCEHGGAPCSLCARRERGPLSALHLPPHRRFPPCLSAFPSSRRGHLTAPATPQHHGTTASGKPTPRAISYPQEPRVQRPGFSRSPSLRCRHPCPTEYRHAPQPKMGAGGPS